MSRTRGDRAARARFATAITSRAGLGALHAGVGTPVRGEPASWEELVDLNRLYTSRVVIQGER